MFALGVGIDVFVKVDILVAVATFGPALIEKNAANAVTIKVVPYIDIFLYLSGLVRQVA